MVGSFLRKITKIVNNGRDSLGQGSGVVYKVLFIYIKPVP